MKLLLPLVILFMLMLSIVDLVVCVCVGVAIADVILGVACSCAKWMDAPIGVSCCVPDSSLIESSNSVPSSSSDAVSK